MSKPFTGKQPLLFDIVETTELTSRQGETYELRLLKLDDDDWGVDDTLTMNPYFGYSEEVARKLYKKLGDKYNGEKTN